MKKKTLIMMLCSLFVLSSVAMGSVAYLTATDTITNIFSVGNVGLKLDETKVDKYGDPVDENGNPVAPGAEAARTEDGNTYHLLPGESYVKDPTITINEGSEDSYVRLMVTITKAKELDILCKAMTALDSVKYPNGLPQDHVSGFNAEDWLYETQTSDPVSNTVTYEFRYKDIVSAQDGDVVLNPLFTGINIPVEITGEQLKTVADFRIEDVAHAIQVHGFADADAAWAAFMPKTTTEAETGSGEEGNQQENPEQDA